MSKRVAVVLAGCGFLDGAEIRESVLTLLNLDIYNAQVSIFAPDKEQHHVINHKAKNEASEKRNVLVEAARIARCQVEPLSKLRASHFDCLVLPGGFGVAKTFVLLLSKEQRALLILKLKLLLKTSIITTRQ